MSRPFSPARIVMVAVVCSLGLAGCGDSDGDGGGSSGDAGQDFGQLPIDFIPGQQDTPPVADPYADYGLSMSILPPGQSDNGGITGLVIDIVDGVPVVGDVPLVSDLVGQLLTTAVDDAVGATGLVPALTRSPHFDDQIAPYWDLTRASPGLMREDLPRYFKDAPLLAPDAAAWADETHVEDGEYDVTIRREPEFNVPHVYGHDRASAFFGLGYVTAQDRLFLLDVIRRAGRGELSKFLGRADFSFDFAINAQAPYTESERTRQFVQLAERYGPLGVQMIEDGQAFIAGVNRYIQDARRGLLQVPIEYLGLGVPLEEFVVEDIIAVATVIQAELGAGGGREERNLQLLQALGEKMDGVAAACRLYHDIRNANEAGTSVTTTRSFPTQEPGSLDDTVCPLRDDFSARFPGAAVFDPGSVTEYEPFEIEPCGRLQQPRCPGLGGSIPGLPGLGVLQQLQDDILGLLGTLFSLADNEHEAQLRQDALTLAQNRFASWLQSDDPGTADMRELVRTRLQETLAALRGLGERFPKSASNALMVNGEHTTSGHPIAVFGPQVSYYVPQLLMEVAMYGGGVAVRGVTFPGLPYIVMGRGADFAWSATSSGADIIDTRVLALCEDPRTSFPGSYRYQGQCVDFERLDEEWTARWNLGTPIAGPADLAQNYRAERHVIRSPHYGPVKGFATVNGSPVALASQRSTYFKEVDAAPPFALTADNRVHDVQSFFDAFSLMSSAFNWFYIDSEDIAFITPSLFPARPSTYYPDFPSWGNGEHDWLGVLPQSRFPKDVNPEHGFLANWNNQPAADWWPADDKHAWGNVYRSNILERRLEDLVGRGEVRVEEVVEAMSDAAYVDLRGQEILPAALEIVESGSLTPDQLQAVNLLREWTERPLSTRSQRRDRDGDGSYDDTQAIALLDAWFRPMIEHTLPQLTVVKGYMQHGFDNEPGPLGSAYQDGWYTYLRRIFDRALGRGGNVLRELRCAGRNSFADCRQALLDSLNEAIATLGGIDNMASWRADQASDEVVSQAIGLIGVPNQHWVNRPTFQQVIQFRRRR